MENKKDVNNRYRAEEENEVSKDPTEDKDTVEESSKTNEKEAPQKDYEQEIKDLKDKNLRLLAEFENYKKRIIEERNKEIKYANQFLLEKLVNELDLFDSVVSFKTDDEKLNNFLIGFQMINNNFKRILEDEGVKKIKSEGEKFNPNYHYAVSTDWDETKDEDIILQELKAGYMFKDRVLRAASVKVNKKTKGNDNNE